MLYVPGGDQRKLEKLSELKPDAFILDLEDAVAVGIKSLAREYVAAAIGRYGKRSVPLFVRVNSFESGLLHQDLLAVVVLGLSGIVLPKAADAEQVKAVAVLLDLLELERGLPAGQIQVIPTIESVRALELAAEIGRASSRVRCLGFGAGDISLELGIEWPSPSRRLSATILQAKARIVMSSRLAELEAPHDSVFPDFRDLATLRAEAQEARLLGFKGKHAIHPAQLDVIRQEFQPSQDEVRRAREIVEAFDRSVSDGVANIHLDGRFVDYPVAERARRLLASVGSDVSAIANAHAPRSLGSEGGDDTATPSSALAGLRVLDLASLYAAPLISTNLADFGAEVIKVEHPRGDDARRWGLTKDGVPLWWKTISRNKRVIALDINNDRDRDVVRRLAADADVLIENFRPGRMESWGLGPEELMAANPRLVYLRMTGFGQTGPYRSQPGFGTLAEAFSGFAHITGTPDGPPTLPPFGLADGVAGITGTFATMIALYWRDAQRGGRGQVIDLSLYEPLFSILGPQLAEFQHLGVIQQRYGNRTQRTSPRNAYETSDGRWVALSGGTQQIANRIFAAIERPEQADDPRFADSAGRRQHADEVDEVVALWIKAHPLAEVLERFGAAEAPIAPVYDIAQIMEDPQYRVRGSYVYVPDDDLGTVAMPAIVPRLSHTPGSIRSTGPTPIGGDSDEILALVHGPSGAYG